MQISLIIVMLNIACYSIKAQMSWEVNYRNTYIPKSNYIDASDLEKLFGTRGTVVANEKNYKTISNGILSPEMIYISDSSKIYFISQSNDTIYWINASKPHTELDTFYVQNDSDYDGKFVIKTDKGITTYYFNNENYLSSAFLSGNKVEYWNLFIEFAQAIPLKVEYEYKDFIMITEAIQIYQKKDVHDDFVISPKKYFSQMELN